MIIWEWLKTNFAIVRLSLWLLTACAALGGSGYLGWREATIRAENKVRELETATQNVTITMAEQQLNDLADRNKKIHDGVIQNANDKKISSAAASDLLTVIAGMSMHKDSCPITSAEKGSSDTATNASGGVAFDGRNRIVKAIAIIQDCAALNDAARQRNVEEGFIP